MQSATESGRLTVKDGFLICPNCRVNKRLLQVRPDTEARSLVVFCRSCKSEIKIDIAKGQCYMSRCQ